MRYILKKYFVVTVAVYLLTQLSSGFTVTGSWSGLFYSSFILGIFMFIAKPLINILMLPINILSLNLASWLINILIVYLWSYFARNIQFSSWQFTGLTLGPIIVSSYLFVRWQTIIISAILLTALINILDKILK